MTRHIGRPLRVVVIGPESTGKTTLAARLARRFGARLVPEFARQFVDRAGRRVSFDDVDEIGRGQRAGEDEAFEAGGDLVVLDTDLVSTFVYSNHYYGDCPAWIGVAARERLADLYLLLAVDVPWIPEGAQREQPERRGELFDLFRATLALFGANVVEVSGSWGERTAIATAALGRFIRSGTLGTSR